MKNRSERVQLIQKIISEGKIGSQDELQIRLQQLGCEVTQATLSRDLRSLQVMKMSDVKEGYIYKLQSNQAGASDISRLEFMADGVLSVEFSGNLGVIKTFPGYANSVAILIDKANPSEILGTIAGDDTILLIIREGVGRNDVIKVLKRIMPKLESKF